MLLLLLLLLQEEQLNAAPQLIRCCQLSAGLCRHFLALKAPEFTRDSLQEVESMAAVLDPS